MLHLIGFIGRILSWRAFMPLGRLTYVVYLVHENFIFIYYVGYQRKPFYYTMFNSVMNYFSILVLSFLLAFVFSVSVEVPFLNLEKLLVNPTNKSKLRIF